MLSNDFHIISSIHHVDKLQYPAMRGEMGIESLGH